MSSPDGQTALMTRVQFSLLCMRPMLLKVRSSLHSSTESELSMMISKSRIWFWSSILNSYFPMLAKLVQKMFKTRSALRISSTKSSKTASRTRNGLWHSPEASAKFNNSKMLLLTTCSFKSMQMRLLLIFLQTSSDYKLMMKRLMKHLLKESELISMLLILLKFHHPFKYHLLHLLVLTMPKKLKQMLKTSRTI